MTYDLILSQRKLLPCLGLRPRQEPGVDWFPATLYNHIADKAYSIRSALLKRGRLKALMLSFPSTKQEPLKANGKASYPI